MIPSSPRPAKKARATASPSPTKESLRWIESFAMASSTIETYQRKGQQAKPEAPALNIGAALRFIAGLGGHL